MSRLAVVCRVATLVVLTLAASLPARAQDAAITEVRAAWEACAKITDNAEAYWIGWRQDFFNGYANDFQFYDGRWTGAPTVLVRSILTDAIAFETITSCFRPDGTLAFVFTQMSSPNYADGGDSGPIIFREGRIYVDKSGAIVRTLGHYADEEGNKLGNLDDERFMMARGCSPVTVHLTADLVETEYFSKLGDIEGKFPEFRANAYDWCGALGAQ